MLLFVTLAALSGAALVELLRARRALALLGWLLEVALGIVGAAILAAVLIPLAS